MMRYCVGLLAAAAIVAALPADCSAGYGPQTRVSGLRAFYPYAPAAFTYAPSNVPAPPYYALHPPVYYSHPVARTYGESPFARRAESKPEKCKPRMIHNPFVEPLPPVEEGELVEPTPEDPTAQLNIIENPYVQAKSNQPRLAQGR